MPQRLTLEIFQAAARDRGGECLSDTYFNVFAPLRFRCGQGHEWEARATNIRSGNWCPRCKGTEKASLSEFQALAIKRGGQCLSDVYLGALAPLRWRCAKGHEWEASAASVKNRGSWCPICGRSIAAVKMQLGMEVPQQLAAQRGGVCLTAEYPVGRNKRFRWRCADGHEWETSLMAVRHAGQWCPTCASGLGERLCRAMFERVFGTPFPKARPKWLVNERGNRMELDGLSVSLGVAFEYQGPQHFARVEHFHRKGSLEQRMRDDAMKVTLCRANAVTLIPVPHKVGQKELQKFIYDECLRLGVAVQRKPTVDLAELDFYPSFDLARLREYAQSRGGQCLTDYFPGVAVPVRWRCAQGHEWSGSFHELSRRNGWCPACTGNAPLTLADMRKLARERGGDCLSAEYVNSTQKLRWRCAQGHIWLAAGNDVRNSGSWCPRCAGVARRSLDDAKKAAADRGGVCLSESYTNKRSRLRWRCANGHEWEASAGNVIGSGNWCAVCSRKAKLTIEQMRALANAKGGECLSDRYVNLNTKLWWRCAQGHHWWATPNNVKHGGSWCPDCAKAASPLNDARRRASSAGANG